MLVGPTAVGKSTIMNAAQRIDPRYHRANNFTSREQRDIDEPGLYTYLSSPEDFAILIKAIEDRSITQYVVSPTKDVIYGTKPQDYPGEFIMQDTFYSAVEHYKQLGFQDSITIGVVVDPQDWKLWFTKRWADDPKDIVLARLQEAQQSLTWLIDHESEITWLYNKPNEQEAAARQLIAISNGESTPSYVDIAKQMREITQKLHKELRYAAT